MSPRIALSLAVLVGTLSFHADGQVDKPAVSVSVKARTEFRAGEAPPVTFIKEQEVAPDGKNGIETNACNQRPGQKSAANGYAKAIYNNIGTITDLDLNTAASATGGKYDACDVCAGQLCMQGSRAEMTRAYSRSQLTATIVYDFPRILNGARRYEIALVPLQTNANASALEFKLTRKGYAAVPLNPNDSKRIEVSPGDQYVLNIVVKANATSADPGDEQSSQAEIGVRVELWPAPFIDATLVEPYILRGTRTSGFEAVGMLAFQRGNGPLRMHCTATLIKPETVLTAAHCLSFFDIDDLVKAKKLYFMVGDSLVNASQPMVVSGYKFPKGELPWKFRFGTRNDDTLEDDVAVLYLDQAAGIRPFDLYGGSPQIDSLIASKQKVTFVGYGLNPDGDDRSSGIKRTAPIPIRQSDARTFGYEATGKQDSNTCHGDSGGPALISSGMTYEVIGITSFGAKDCTKGRSMRTDAYADWIRNNWK